LNQGITFNAILASRIACTHAAEFTFPPLVRTFCGFLQ
jgi:hypothetical protein